MTEEEVNRLDFRRELALADAEADESLRAIAAEEATAANVIDADAGVIQIDDDHEDAKPYVRKPMAARSEAWEHFTKVLDSNGILKEGLCKYCNRTIQATTGRTGTSSMLRHLTSCKKNPNRNHDPKQGTLQATPGGAINNWKYDLEELRKAFAEMVIEDELPFAFGEKSGFKFRTSLTPYMIQALVCTQDWLRRSTDPVDIKENLEELEELEKELLEEFGDKGKGKRKADCSAADASVGLGKSGKVA